MMRIWLNRPGSRIAACMVLTLSAQLASATSLAVVNRSFEDPVVTTIPGFLNSTAGPFCFPDACPTIAGWTFAGLGGLFRPNGSVFSSSVLDGAQVYFSDSRGDGSGVATQVLAATFQAVTPYALTVAIGNRADIPFGDGRIALFAGNDPGNVVASLDLASIVAPSSGTFKDVLLAVSPMQVLDAGAVGQSIGILVGGNGTGSQAVFDNVRVAAIPEPESYLMLLAGIGLMGLTGRRRRRDGVPA